MRVKLLRSSTTDNPQLQALTTFLVNDCIAIDGGSIGLALGLQEMQNIRNILLTHAHIDHIATLPIFIAEMYAELEFPMVVHASPEVISALRLFIFNGQIWPNFEKIPLKRSQGPTLEFRVITPGAPFEINGIRVTAVPVNHVVPTVGLKLQDQHVSVIFTSDTYVTDEIWDLARETETLKAIFVDVSYPNEMENLAAASKHLTPQSLASELAKVKRAVEVFATHIKPGKREQVLRQLGELKSPPVFAAEIGRVYEW